MAVYTDVSTEDLNAFLADYELGELLSYKGIAEGVENSNYLLHTDAGYFILTLYEKRVEEADLPFFLGLMDHLASRGIDCPTPIIGAVAEAAGHGGATPGLAVPAPGISPDGPPPDAGACPGRPGDVGRVVSRVNAGRVFVPAARMPLKGAVGRVDRRYR